MLESKRKMEKVRSTYNNTECEKDSDNKINKFRPEFFVILRQQTQTKAL